jgi:AcrR family transcriptional regulator
MANIAYWPDGQYNSLRGRIFFSVPDWMRFQMKKRLAPAARRAEIVATASRIAMAEGLESLTLRRVAEEMGVVPGLVNHYFPVADDLVAAAFGFAAAAERDGIFAGLDPASGPLARLRAVLGVLLRDAADVTSLLWLDAWQATRRRPALRAEVAAQMRGWQERMSGLISAGAAEGAFNVDDARRTATRVMALIDGFSIQAAMRSEIVYHAVREMVLETIAREVGVAAATLLD